MDKGSITANKSRDLGENDLLPKLSSPPIYIDDEIEDRQTRSEDLHRELTIIERAPSLILEQLSDQAKQQRADIMSTLHNDPPSIKLQAYFDRLREGSHNWDIETLIEGAKSFANLTGPGRAEYYSNALMGLHYRNSFTELWNRTYAGQPITFWDQDFRFQCPPSWSNGLEESRPILRYQEEGNLSQALNDLIQYPTTIDCGMHCQLVPFMSIRYVIGDAMFDQFFKFRKGEFTLTQGWEESLLKPFFDDPRHCVESQHRVQIRTFFNYPTYLSKHPGGEELLQNVVQIDDSYVIFDPDATQNVLSATDLENSLIQGYNSPRDFADFEQLWLWTAMPDHVHSDFAPKCFGTLAEESKAYTTHVLTKTEWEESRAAREHMSRGLHFIFNYQRLVDCLRNKDAPIQGDILLRAEVMKMLHLRKAIGRINNIGTY